MLHCALSQVLAPRRPRVCAVSFLNTVPLVWGMMHGQQRDLFELSFSVPSECADRVAAGQADLGIVPVAEIQRFGWPYLKDTGIACRGPVRSILLISKTPPQEIRTLAADSSSRTSVMLTRIILGRKYGARPRILTHAPDLSGMLATADAALIIGDPALRIEPKELPYRVLDLGQEWTAMTGLPMVFALWAGPDEDVAGRHRQAFVDSWRFGLNRMEDIIAVSQQERKLPADVIRRYLTEHIAFELTAEDLRGLDLFFAYTSEL